MSWLQIEIERALEACSIAELARTWGLPRWTIDDIRRGQIKVPGALYLAKIAAGLGMTTDEVLTALTPPEDGRSTDGGGSSQATRRGERVRRESIKA